MERKEKHLSKRSLRPDRWLAFYTGFEEAPDVVLGLPVVSYKRRIFKNKPSSRCRPSGCGWRDLYRD